MPPRAGSPQRQATSKTRVQGVTTEQVIKATAGVLQRIVVANADAAAQTLTVSDGATAQVVLRLAIGSSESFEFGVPFPGGIRVTPSSVNIDALVIYD